MPYVVSASCTWSKARSCVVVCPVDCFYEDELQLYIHPDECIDCGACEPECPSQAIRFEEPGSPAEDLRVNAARTGGSHPDVRPARQGPAMVAYDEPMHRAKRDAFLADLQRAAAAMGEERLADAVQSWIPVRPLRMGESRPKGPGPGVEARLLGILRESFPSRWRDHLFDVRSLLAHSAPLSLSLAPEVTPSEAIDESEIGPEDRHLIDDGSWMEGVDDDGESGED